MFSHITIKAKITKTSAVLKSVIKKSITTQKEAELSIEEPKQSKAKSVGRFIKKLVKSSKSKKTQQTEAATVSVINKESTESTIIAQRIWDQDTTVYHNLEKVVEWIGSNKESSQAILTSYMSHFDFTNMKLEQAFRNMCAKLYLKGETQQIDRVLYQFSVRYFECNPIGIFGSIDIIHAVVYSLLLLNTDLHVAKGDYKRMSRSAFVKNTMAAISPSSEYSYSLERASSTRSATRLSLYSKSLSTLSIGSVKSWDSEMKHTLKQMYTNIRSHQITDPSVESNSSRRSSIKSDVSSMTSSSTQSTLVQSEIMPCTSSAPYYKEGVVSRKHLLESKDQKAKHRDWKQCFMVVDRNQLNMYKMGTDTMMASIDLKHTLATVLPVGYKHQHAFTLEQSNGSKHVFQAESAEQVVEWVSTCNYWAARESKEPLPQGISSMEYGWGKCLQTDSTVRIFDWQSPSSPVISSTLEEPTQLDVLHKHVETLTTELDQHRDIKQKMETRFMGVTKGKALSNWQNKSHYLLSEIIKYQNYCNSIEKSLLLQASAMA